MCKCKRRPYLIDIVGPSWAHGGTEQHARTLNKFLDPERIQVRCVHVTAPQYFDAQQANTEPFLVLQTPPEDLEQATRDVDAVLHWGIDLDKYVRPSRRQARIHIAHGASDWGLRMIAGSTRANDYTICVSQHVADSYKLDRPFCVINNGIDTSRLTNNVSPEDARAQLGINQETFVIGYLGRLAIDKQIDRIIHAAQLMNSNTLVLICGRGDDEARLRRIASESPNTKVAFTWMDDYLGNFFQVLDAFVMPSAHEGFCLATAEAMWSAVPIVTTFTGLVPYNIQPGWSGLITTGCIDDIVEKLEAIQQQIEASVWMAHQARNTANEKFMPTTMAMRYADVITQQIEAKPDHEYSRVVPY